MVREWYACDSAAGNISRRSAQTPKAIVQGSDHGRYQSWDPNAGHALEDTNAHHQPVWENPHRKANKKQRTNISQQKSLLGPFRSNN